MASRQLEYIVSLRDQLTPEISKISREMDRLGGQGQKAIERIALGAAGLYGIGASVMSGLQPAIEMNNELGKIKGLGESAKGLELLQKRALSFSTQWGESAAEFVDASYDIKSAIDGLSAEELVSFTEISAVTGKATQTSGKIMTDYLGTMYSVLGASKEADKISRAKTLMAQTAYTANKFKSDGAKIAQAFSTLGNQATLAGVKVNEQFAILGTLQNEMGGGESATKYSAFLSSIGEAGDKLGMNFRDVNGILKSTPEILQMLKRKYGDVIDDRESAELKKALGRKEGLDFIKALIGKVDELGGSITEIGKINGLNEVKAGAVANIDVFKRLQAVVKGIQIAIGNQLLKVLDPFLQKIADVGSYLVDWFTANKYIARLVGLVLGGVAAVAALASAVTMLTGLFALVKVGFAIFGALAVPVAILALKIGAVMGFIYLFRAQIEKFVSGFMAGFEAIGVSFEPLKHAFSTLFGVIGGIISRFTGIKSTSAVWSDLGEAVGLFIAGGLNILIHGLEFVIQLASLVLDVFSGAFFGIAEIWDNAAAAFTNGNILLGFVEIGQGIIKIITDAFGKIWLAFKKGVNTLVGWLNNIPGVNLPTFDIPIAFQHAESTATGVANSAVGVANNTLKVEGTNAKALTQPKSGKGVAGQVNQQKNVHQQITVNVHGADAGKQAGDFIKQTENKAL